jgi:hypothetical protein
MPKVEAHAPVDADLQTIWRVLLDRIEHPDRYMDQLESFRFTENTDDYAVRELSLPGGMTLTERITIDERQGEICYQLLDHPLFEGSVYNALIPPDPTEPKARPIVQFRMDWQPKSLEARALELETRVDLEDSLRHAVNYVKDMAEHLEKTRA